jgi:hypothetical protein
LIETRSGADLARALDRASHPILLLDLADRPRAGLEDLDTAVRAAPTVFALVLSGQMNPELTQLARELGASFVLPRSVPPPVVLNLLVRWLALSTRRQEAEGWQPGELPPSEQWLEPLIVAAGRLTTAPPVTELPR